MTKAERKRTQGLLRKWHVINVKLTCNVPDSLRQEIRTRWVALNYLIISYWKYLLIKRKILYNSIQSPVTKVWSSTSNKCWCKQSVLQPLFLPIPVSKAELLWRSPWNLFRPVCGTVAFILLAGNYVKVDLKSFYRLEKLCKELTSPMSN